MSKILLGKSGNKNVHVDLDVLLRTRLLVQANSGGGKSWLLRRLAEQLYGKVPVIILDPEGEFATLREKFGYVLVGKGGETPADIRSAAVVAHKLLELRVSAVCDLFEMKDHDRHVWVRLFCESLINAPKHLWRKTVIIVDEAQMFLPEKGYGESEASPAVKSLTTRGRKRRFCAVFATQRLAALDKGGSSMLLNRLVGLTFEDVDLKRAITTLSVEKEKVHEIELALKQLEPGNFFAFGRAITKDRLLFKVGGVQTTHPDIDDDADAPPPPPPEKVKSLLPKLADLPKIAEEKAATEKELRAELRQAKADLAAAKREQPKPAPAASKTVSDPAQKATIQEQAAVIKALQHALEKAMKFIVEIEARDFGADVPKEEVKAAINAAVDRGLQLVQVKLDRRNADVEKLKAEAKRITDMLRAITKDKKVTVAVSVAPQKPFTVDPPKVPRPAAPPVASNGDWKPGKCDRKLMQVLAQFPDGISFAKLSLCSGYSQTSSSYEKGIGNLRTNGILVGGNTEMMRPTDRIEQYGPFDPLPAGQELVRYWINFPHFGIAERTILKALADNPDGVTFQRLAELSVKPDGISYSATSSSFEKAVGALRTAGLLVGRNTETMRPSDDLLEAIQST